MQLRVWLLTVAEPLPIDTDSPRLLRMGILAQMLEQQGIDVVWWTSNFRHVQKTKRFSKTTSVQATRRLKVWCLDSRPYFHNQSLARLMSNFDIAREFRRHAKEEARPDLIMASYPIPELALEGAKYARRNGVPSIVDIRDLWPDIWPTALPRPLRPVSTFLLSPFYWHSRRTLRAFSCITAITEEILKWGIQRAGRSRQPDDEAFPLAYPVPTYSAKEVEDAKSFWEIKLKPMSEVKLTLCYFGTVVQRSRLDVVVDAVKWLDDTIRRQVRVILCGEGAALGQLKEAAQGIPQIMFPGWVTGAQIRALSSISDAGLLPYPSDLDFKLSMPNKSIEYLAHGLPILTSLAGPISELVKTENCGRLYEETNHGSLAHLISDLVAHKRDLAEMSVNASRVFNERFSAAKVYGRLISKMSALADRPPAPLIGAKFGSS